MDACALNEVTSARTSRMLFQLAATTPTATDTVPHFFSVGISLSSTSNFEVRK